MYDVSKELYADIIRQMIRHENDVTNHRIMWLLVGQGFIANAFAVTGGRETAGGGAVLALIGILVTLSAFMMLYKSYLARGYLLFLGKLAKEGRLPADFLPITGWPGTRIKGWWKDAWLCPWIGQSMHLLEPFLFLPALFMFIWSAVILHALNVFSNSVIILLAAIGTVGIFSVCTIVFVRSESKNDVRLDEPAADVPSQSVNTSA